MLMRVMLFLLSCAVAGGEPIKVIAHRGASGHAPENTLAAFREAVKAGADYFELDCRLSKDDKVIIVHDAELERTGGGEKVAVASLTLAELQTKDAGTWFGAAFKGERMPTLLESLAVATKECGVYVEIKSEKGDGTASKGLMMRASGEKKLTHALRKELLAMADASETRSPLLTRQCIADIRAKKMEKQVVIQSFSPLICFVALCEAPEIRTELLINDDKDDPQHFDRMVDFGMLIGVAGFNPAKDSLSKERLDRFHAANKSVAVYTVDEPADFAKFAALGVTAMITDLPAECRTALGAGK